ncbi:Hypothetical protein PBC10988_2900 [Planctomycetales bacterium 10988]|nr:Hypothetical protein PBC10988_2900 [Planctomycetales bacterium 10988]
MAIYVENVDHANQLLKKLKGWPVLADPAALSRELHPKLRAAILQGQSIVHSFPQKLIVTASSFPRLGPIDILIRADAGKGLANLPAQYFVCHETSSRTLCLVDIGDQGSPLLSRIRKARWKLYHDRGWPLLGSKPEIPYEEPYHYPGVHLHCDQSVKTSLGYLAPFPFHPKTAEEAYYDRLSKRKKKKVNRHDRLSLRQTVHPDHLHQVLRYLRSKGGNSPGMDGYTYRDLSPSEWGKVLRSLSLEILQGNYLPQKLRTVEIPKSNGQGTRVLKLGSICDRIVQRAFSDRLSPQFEKLFLQGSWGFRPNRSLWGMLADLKNHIEESTRWVLAIDDIRQAFDHVRIEDVEQAHERARLELLNLDEENRLVISSTLTRLVGEIFRGTQRNLLRGIPEGNNYSPHALNLLLHHVHDLPFTREGCFPFWYRYADNLTYVCQSESESRQCFALPQKE